MHFAAALVVSLCIAGCASKPPTHDAATTSISVVTLNLWHDKQDWPRRQEMIVAELQALAPDAVFLQEVLQDDGLPNQAETLAQRLDHDVRFFSADAPGQARRYGNAILVRARVMASGARALEPLDDYRTAGWVRTSIADRPVDLFVTHLHHTPEGGAIRAQQIAGLQDFMRASRGDRAGVAIVAGDFNTLATAPELAPLWDAFGDAYAAAHPGVDVEAPDHATLHPQLGHPPVRIDHVLYPRASCTVVDARRILHVPDATGAWPSDHAGVWAKLECRP